MKTKQYMELSGGSRAMRTFWMQRVDDSSKEASLPARAWLRPLLLAEGRHPLAARVRSICAKPKLFFCKPYKWASYRAECSQDRHVCLHHTHSHVSPILSHQLSAPRWLLVFVSLNAVLHTSTSIVAELPQDHYTAVQYLDGVLKILP